MCRLTERGCHCRYDFHLEEDDDNGCYKLEVDCPRFMDTSLVDCDVQPTYVRVSIKDKVSLMKSDMRNMSKYILTLS